MRNQRTIYIRYATHVELLVPMPMGHRIMSTIPRNVLTGEWAFAVNVVLWRIYRTITHA